MQLFYAMKNALIVGEKIGLSASFASSKGKLSFINPNINYKNLRERVCESRNQVDFFNSSNLSETPIKLSWVAGCPSTINKAFYSTWN